ncbi:MULTISPECIES: hypothetical protein [Chromobacterium]|uniref:DUF2730 domain-containing protein n=1 Tax=Chromobacterium violaceum (strain ATCC 12472 / DSM 30191 / JCM 1249 / CCUG 213 / NBRC 12614 / NCIMB 9131 / NCTC 9757 / MK) TaxID=243365 RepID=Q7NW47_CHRVO|nr:MULTISPECIES: hypothetical protein [Chromobacterium]AAQ59816.1 hypothetical protein CV_2143 [Chromobacterium violaceum ATCC 12472]AVG15372.1 hypothetical protein CFN79_05570 [Chromobacterium vaccinii]MBP4049214.1 hypothetical protein [Chromobacterium violaceum]MCD4501104.1 hypothetical protein [Chromobacterium vaccinii]SUX35354.1 Uncharacterised protein [Chromobacterium violaceum]
MTIGWTEATWAMGLVIAWSGALLGVIRAMLTRLVVDMDKRLDKQSHDIARLDGEVQRLLAELPLHYQRRDDAIRELTVLVARIDAVGTRLDGCVRRDDHIRSETVLHAKLDAVAARLDKLMNKENRA